METTGSLQQQEEVVDSQTSSHVRSGVSHHVNNNYSVSASLCRRLTLGQEDCNLCTCASAPPHHRNNQKTANLYQCHQTRPVSEETINCCQIVQNVNLVVVNHAHIVTGQPQRKCVSPTIVRQHQSLKYVNNDELCTKCPVGVRINIFWETWAALGAQPKIVQMLKEGYTLPFQSRPNSTWLLTIISCYVHSHRNLYLLEALHQVKKSSRVGQKSRISGLLNPTIFGPKTKQQ